jgi:hypothetical protein
MKTHTVPNRFREIAVTNACRKVSSSRPQREQRAEEAIFLLLSKKRVGTPTKRGILAFSKVLISKSKTKW